MKNYSNKKFLSFGLILFILLGSITSFAQLKKYKKFKLNLVEGLDTLGLQTGDLAFFQNTSFYGQMTQIGTLSPFTHSSMIVVAEDSSILLTHATNNDYGGFLIPVIGENKPRNGVILTRLGDLFASYDYGKTGAYKHIWIRKLKDSKIKRPNTKKVLQLYEKYKEHPFESSLLNFILSAFDLKIHNKDLLSFPADQEWMCSEYLCHLFVDLSFPFKFKEPPNETTPVDIYTLIGDFYEDPIIYEFQNGKYILISENTGKK